MVLHPVEHNSITDAGASVSVAICDFFPTSINQSYELANLMISFRKRALINHSESTPTDLHEAAVINFLLIGESRKKAIEKNFFNFHR